MLKNSTSPWVLVRIAFAVAFALATASTVDAAVATWTANTEPDIAGYKLSYGTQPGVHTVVLDAGKVTTFTFNPPPGFKYYVVIQAYNSSGQLSDKSAEVVVDIPVVNAAPTLVQPANQTTKLNANVSLQLSGNPGSGRTLTFSAKGLPTGLSISAAGLITGVARAVGTFAVTVTAADGALTASKTFTWTVTDDASPRGPSSGGPQTPVTGNPQNPAGGQLSITSPSEQMMSYTNRSVSLQLATTGGSGTLRFSATGLPTGLSINTFSGMISGTPTTTGVYNVVVTVTDGTNSATARINWQIIAAGTKASTEANDPSPESNGDPDVSSATRLEHVGVSGDFDGDGRADLATYRSTSGEWRIWTSSSKFQEATVFAWGEAGDLPMPADYNGDRVTDLALYRPSTGTWHLFLSKTQTPMAVHWGGPEDRPVALDHDGDGKADLAVVRGGGYAILLSSTNYTTSVTVQ